MIVQAMTTSFKREILQAVHNLDTDVFKIALYTTNANIDASTTVYTSAGESTGTGYVAGGLTLANLGVTASGTVAYASWSDATWTGLVTQCAGALIYNTSKGNKAVAVLNFGGTYTTNAATPFTVTFPNNSSTTAIVIIN
jgi:hypothetical protein